MWRHYLSPNASANGSLELSLGPGPGLGPGLSPGPSPLRVAPCCAARVRASVPAARELLRLAAAAP